MELREMDADWTILTTQFFRGTQCVYQAIDTLVIIDFPFDLSQM